MWELYEEMWNEQIGNRKEVGYDFSGREIHKKDFGNPISKYGWTLLPLGNNDTYLVVHNKTMEEFPKVIDGEFIVNGKIFEVVNSSSNDGNLQINEITYQTKERSVANLSRNDVKSISSQKKNQEVKQIESNVEMSRQHIEEDLKELKRQLKNQKNIDDQHEEIEQLREKLRFYENEYQNNLMSMRNNGDYQSTQQIEILRTISERFQEQEAELNELRKSQIDQERKIIELEKTATLNFALNNQKTDEIRMSVNNDDTALIWSNSNTSNNSKKEPHIVEWEKQYGDKLVALDYANQLMIKPEFGKNVEGGWGIDSYSQNESSEFISSLKSISARAGKQIFSVDGKAYKVVKIGKNYSIEYKPETEYAVYSKQVIGEDVKKLGPTEVRKFNGTGSYESYASLLINLNHFPVDYLDKFEEFLMNMVSDLPAFKDKYIYMNKRAYESGNSNITSYARIFFKYSSTTEEIDILMASLALKNALIQFTNNYRSKNNRFVVSFSTVLTSHKGEFKFIQAQTNYDILRRNPVPFKLPQYKLVIDSEFNSLLKYHENELWKKITPFALDYAGHTYYVCDVDVEEYKKVIS